MHRSESRTSRSDRALGISAPLDLEQVAEFLARPDTYPDKPTRVQRAETHISWVFLTDRFAYKLLKPVRFDFLDYSTPRRRLQNCRRAVALGRRLAPDVYRGVIKLTRSRSGQLRLGGNGQVVAHVIQMRRLPDELMLDELIRTGNVSRTQIGRLVDLLVSFYRDAMRSQEIDRCARPRAIRRNVEANFNALMRHPNVVAQSAMVKARAAQLQLLALRPQLFHDRIEQQRICEGHGDLRAEHICMLPSPAVFDPIEFSRALRSVDPIDELSFLSMDCDFLDGAYVGNAILRAYRKRTADPCPEELVAFYKSYRACVRAKVEAIRGAQLKPRARRAARRRRAERYLQLAADYADTFYRPKLLITVGLMGSGKSTVASALAGLLGLEVLRSDEVRHEMAGRRDRAAAYGTGIYAPPFTRRVYSTLLSRAKKLLLQGGSVMVDATFLDRKWRERARTLAQIVGATPQWLYCTCPPRAALRRLAVRSRDDKATSDGRADLFEQQREHLEPPTREEPCVVVRTEGSPSAVAGRIIMHMRRHAT